VQAPVRLLLALRPTVSPALLVATATSTVVFVATPFLLPAVADDQGVSLGTVGWMSAAQLAGFVISSWVGGRFLHPVRSLFVAGALLAVFANLASAWAPTFPILVGTRFLSGLWLGLAAWFAWQEAFGDAGKTGDVTVIAPLVSMVVAPGISLLIENIGISWLFVVLAGISALPILFAGQIPTTERLRPHRTRHAATTSARAILLALGLVTLGGSSVFVYGAAIGTELNGLSPLAVSLIYSANAIASIPAARWFGPRGPAGFWFLGTSICAFLIPAVRHDAVFAITLVTWGFVFFMGVPAAFGLLASRSNFPEERAGDAQAVMALGRVFGPLLGGALISGGSATALGIVAGSIILVAATMLIGVERTSTPTVHPATT
jgi:DHA1 family inner membrane transport protein